MFVFCETVTGLVRHWGVLPDDRTGLSNSSHPVFVSFHYPEDKNLFIYEVYESYHQCTYSTSIRQLGQKNGREPDHHRVLCAWLHLFLCCEK
jgi:hypothetical protein